MTHLTPKQHNAVIKLVGKKCIVKCYFNGKEVEALWDTGAQVSIISEGILKGTSYKIRDIEELLETPNLCLSAANGTPIQYKGWVEVSVQLSTSAIELKVPFLVTNDELDRPIIGYNVIEEVITSSDNDSLRTQVVKQAIPNIKDADALVTFIQNASSDYMCNVKTNKKDIVIKKGTSTRVSCRANTGAILSATPVIFEPDEVQSLPDGVVAMASLVVVGKRRGKSCVVDINVHNSTNHDVTIRGRTVLGRLQMVQSVTPVDVTYKPVASSNSNSVKTQVPQRERAPSTSGTLPEHLQEIDLQGLTADQAKIVKSMLIEEKDVNQRRRYRGRKRTTDEHQSL